MEDHRVSAPSPKARSSVSELSESSLLIQGDNNNGKGASNRPDAYKNKSGAMWKDTYVKRAQQTPRRGRGIATRRKEQVSSPVTATVILKGDDMPFGLRLMIAHHNEMVLDKIFAPLLESCRARRKSAILRAWKASA